MRRHILGVLAATLAAPYLVLLLWSLSGLMSGDHVGLTEPIDLLKIIPLGTFGLGLFGIPLLILASVCALAVNAARRPTWRGPALGGAILGLGFTTVLFADSRDGIAFMTSGALSGALCGWIYGRIAMGQRSGKGDIAPQKDEKS